MEAGSKNLTANFIVYSRIRCDVIAQICPTNTYPRPNPTWKMAKPSFPSEKLYTEYCRSSKASTAGGQFSTQSALDLASVAEIYFETVEWPKCNQEVRPKPTFQEYSLLTHHEVCNTILSRFALKHVALWVIDEPGGSTRIPLSCWGRCQRFKPYVDCRNCSQGAWQCKVNHVAYMNVWQLPSTNCNYDHVLSTFSGLNESTYKRKFFFAKSSWTAVGNRAV